MRWLVTGASGTLGGYLLRALRSESVVAWSGSTRNPPFIPIDLADSEAVAAGIRAAKPDIIVHAGAMARVDACFADPERARQINTNATKLLCDLSGNARVVYVSTDLVFDGECAPYTERDRPSPLSVYGRSKAEAEPAVLATSSGVVARVSLMFGPNLNGRRGFFDNLLDALRTGRPLTLFEDEWRTPLYLMTAAMMIVTLARSDFAGLIHLGGPERLSRLEMGQRLARVFQLSDSSLVTAQRNATPGAEPRPRDVSLDSGVWRSVFPHADWPAFDEALMKMRGDMQ
jgi:dTDP-4-dehydrorhamnose reductase